MVVITKSDLAARDAGLFTSIAAHAPVAVNFTITTADDALCQRIERNVCPTSKRLEAIRVLSEAGISCGITLMPLLPFLNDNSHNLKQVVALSAQAGAKWIATYGGLSVHSGPLVLGAAPLKLLAPAMDMNQTVSRRFEPSSRTTLMGEQPNPWDLLQPQDVMSRHRGAKPPRRYELLGEISLLSPG